MAIIALTAKLKACTLAGVAVSSGNVSASYEMTGDKVEFESDALPYKQYAGMRNLRGSLEVEIQGQPPAALKVGLSGATAITPATIDSADGFSATAGDAIALGTMVIEKISSGLTQDNVPTTKVSLTAVGKPWFIPGG